MTFAKRSAADLRAQMRGASIRAEYVKSEVEDQLPPDWELEQRAFHWANSDLPEDAKTFIKDLWRAYCDMEARGEVGDVTDKKLDAGLKAFRHYYDHLDGGEEYDRECAEAIFTAMLKGEFTA